MTISPQAQKAASYLMNARFTEREVGCYVQNIINAAAKPLVEALERVTNESQEWNTVNFVEVALAQWRKENGG